MFVKLSAWAFCKCESFPSNTLVQTWSPDSIDTLLKSFLHSLLGELNRKMHWDFLSFRWNTRWIPMKLGTQGVIIGQWLSRNNRPVIDSANPPIVQLKKNAKISRKTLDDPQFFPYIPYLIYTHSLCTEFHWNPSGISVKTGKSQCIFLFNSPRRETRL